MKVFTKYAVLAGFAASTLSLVGCSSDVDSSEPTSDGSTGSVGLELALAPGVTVNTVSWAVSNAGTGFSRTGSVNVQFSNRLEFRIGALPAGDGYSIALDATTVDGALVCVGSADFSVLTDVTDRINVHLVCAPPPEDTGNIDIIGSTEICAHIEAIDVSPLETTVDSPIDLSATVSPTTPAPSYAWTATAGSFDDPSSPTPVFTCPSSPTSPTITLTVSPRSPECTTVTSRSVTVTCDALDLTFTNVYSNVIGPRCVSCHQPGRSGVTVGLLDMSTQALAYANLIGVPAAGTGAGTSGITCESTLLTRVIPNDAANSLFLNKVLSKVTGATPVCGSPMPLPASAIPLTGGQIALITNWIDTGALNN